MRPLTAILTGPTASGKTAIALEFCAGRSDLEIINADSLLFYRGLDIGTAKPTPEELALVPHHLIDHLSPDETFTAGDFHRACLTLLDELHSRGKRPLVVGGSGFYLKALMHGLWDVPKADPELRKELETRTSRELYDELFNVDEEAALRIGINDRYRLVRAHEILRQSGLTPTQLETQQREKKAHSTFQLLWIDREPEELSTRIALRTEQMIRDGLIDETRRLLENHPESRALLAIGYAETCAHLQGAAPAGRKVQPGIPGLMDEISLSTRQLVKRQRTWFRNQFRKSVADGDSQDRVHEFMLDADRSALLQKLEELYNSG